MGESALKCRQCYELFWSLLEADESDEMSPRDVCFQRHCRREMTEHK